MVKREYMDKLEELLEVSRALREQIALRVEKEKAAGRTIDSTLDDFLVVVDDLDNF